jgi:membrane protein implicated in regulation of membrane protease activity
MLMPMAFLLACGAFDVHGGYMSRIVRISVFALTLSALAVLWVATGPLTAIGVGFSIFAYLFVLAMKSAAEEIQRFDRDQRPDLYA